MPRSQRRDRRRPRLTTPPTTIGAAAAPRMASAVPRETWLNGPHHRIPSAWRTIAVGAAVTLLAFGVYTATAARDIVFGDTPELTAAALTLGVAHPPGYPIFTMLGWLFGHLPLGTLPFRVALLSVVCHAATVGVVYGTTYRFTRSVAAAAVAGAALAFEPLFWYWSLVADVFPLNDLLSATMLLLVALWHEHPERKRLLVAGGLVGGLGMANQQTIALLAPAVVYLMWSRRNVLLRDPRTVLNAGVAFLVGFVPYLELPIAASRHPLISWGDISTPGDLVGQILRTSYGTTSLIVDQSFRGGSAFQRIVAVFAAFDPLQWLLFAGGVAYAWRTKRWYATYLLVAFVTSGPLFAAYSNANLGDETTYAVLQRFFLMPHVVVAPLAGFAIVGIADVAGRLQWSRRSVELGATAVGALAALAFVPLYYQQVDQSGNHIARTFAEDLLSTIKPNSIFLGGGDPVVFTLWYLQTVEGARPDVTVVGLPLVPADWYVRELRRAHPDLVLKYDRYGPGGAPMRAFLDDNRARPIAALGDLPDNSANGAYWFYSRGITYEVEPESTKITLDQMAAENEKILATYHPPRYSDLTGPFRIWERLVLVDYSQGYYRVGHEYELGAASINARSPQEARQLYEQAKSWYEQALKVNPTLAEAKQGLQRVTPLSRGGPTTLP